MVYSRCHSNTRLRDIGQKAQKRANFCHSIRHSIYGMETEPFTTSWVLVGRADEGFHGCRRRLPKIGPLSEWKIGRPESGEALYKQEVARNPVGLFCRLFKPTQSSTRRVMTALTRAKLKSMMATRARSRKSISACWPESFRMASALHSGR